VTGVTPTASSPPPRSEYATRPFVARPSRHLRPGRARGADIGVNKGKPGNPAQTEKYLAGKFGARLDEAREAMEALAASQDPGELQGRGFRLYERFRPEVPASKSGWGAKGELDLTKVREAGS
jgi:hypothetical protein